MAIWPTHEVACVGSFLTRQTTGQSGSNVTGFLPLPTAEAELTFLSKLPRIFAEGNFTATYKYALLVSLADLAIEVGADDGCELQLSTRQIGERFIQLYWRQATPYGTGREGLMPAVLV